MREKTFRESIDARLSGLEVPQGRQAAILRRALQQERPAPRKPLVTLALAIVLALALTAAGLAVALRFGVIGFNRGQEDNAAFKAHILTVNQAYETDDLSLTVNEAVFDGMSLSFTMNILPKEGGEPVYIHPRVSAQCGGEPLMTDPQGCLGDFYSGFWVPERDPLGPEGCYGADYAIIREDEDGSIAYDTATQPVTWTLSFDIIKPNWPVESNDIALTGTADDPPFEEYMALPLQDGAVRRTGPACTGRRLFAGGLCRHPASARGRNAGGMVLCSPFRSAGAVRRVLPRGYAGDFLYNGRNGYQAAFRYAHLLPGRAG